MAAAPALELIDFTMSPDRGPSSGGYQVTIMMNREHRIDWKRQNLLSNFLCKWCPLRLLHLENISKLQTEDGKQLRNHIATSCFPGSSSIFMGGKKVCLDNANTSSSMSDAHLMMTIPSYDISAMRKTQSVSVAKVLNNAAEATSNVDEDSKVELLDFAVDASAWQRMAGDWAPGDLFDVQLWQDSTSRMWRAVVSMWNGNKALTPLDNMVVGRLIVTPTLQRARTEGAYHFDPDLPFIWSTDIKIMLAKPTNIAPVPMAVAISADDGNTWKISLQAFVFSSVSQAHASSLAASRLLSAQSDGPVTCIWGNALGLNGDIEWRPRNAQAEGLLHLRLQRQKRQKINNNRHKPEPGELVWFLTPQTMTINNSAESTEPADDPENSDMKLKAYTTESRDALRRVWVMGRVLNAPSKFMRTVRLLMQWNQANTPLPLPQSPDSAEADFLVHTEDMHPVDIDPFSPHPSEPSRCYGLAMWRAFMSRASLGGREALQHADFLQLMHEQCEQQHAQRHICRCVVENEARLIIHTRGNQLYEASRSHGGKFAPVGIPNRHGDASRDSVWPIGKLLQRASLAPRLHVGAMAWTRGTAPHGRIVRVFFDRGLPNYVVRPFKICDAKVLAELSKNRLSQESNLAQPESIQDDGAPRSLKPLEECTLPSGECVVATNYTFGRISPGALKHTAAADSPIGTEIMREYKAVLPDVLQVAARKQHFAALVAEPLKTHCSCRGRRPAVYIQLTPNKGEPKHNKWCQHHFRQCFYADVDLSKPEQYEERLIQQFRERQIYQINNGNTLTSLFDWCTMCPPRPTKCTHECLQCGLSLCENCFVRHKADGHQQVRRKAGVLSRIKSVRIWGNAKFLKRRPEVCPFKLPWPSKNSDKTLGKTVWPFDTGYGVDFAAGYSSAQPLVKFSFMQPHDTLALDLREHLHGTPFLVDCGDDYAVIASINDYRREPNVHGERDVEPIVSVNFVDQHHADGARTALMIMPHRRAALPQDIELIEDPPEVLRSLEVELWVWGQEKRFHLLHSGQGERASFNMIELFDTMPITDAVEDLVFRERDELYGARYCDEAELRKHMDTFLFKWEQSANDRLNTMKQSLLLTEQRAFGRTKGSAVVGEAKVVTAPYQEIQKQQKVLKDKLRTVQAELLNSFAHDVSMTPDERAEWEQKIQPLRRKLQRLVAQLQHEIDLMKEFTLLASQADDNNSTEADIAGGSYWDSFSNFQKIWANDMQKAIQMSTHGISREVEVSDFMGYGIDAIALNTELKKQMIELTSAGYTLDALDPPDEPPIEQRCAFAECQMLEMIGDEIFRNKDINTNMGATMHTYLQEIQTTNIELAKQQVDPKDNSPDHMLLENLLNAI